MTAKDCGHHHDHRKTLYRNIFAALIALVLLVLLTILLIFLILRPTKPKFILIDATVYAFNICAPNFLTTTLQVSDNDGTSSWLVVAKAAPNSKISIIIYYFFKKKKKLYMMAPFY